MKITEGPWKIDGPFRGGECMVESDESYKNGYFRIANTFGPDAEANARAIAKVPEMVDLLRTLSAIRDDPFSFAAKKIIKEIDQ